MERKKSNRTKNNRTIKEEEEEIEQENSRLREWIKEDNNEIGNIFDLYYELSKSLG